MGSTKNFLVLGGLLVAMLVFALVVADRASGNSTMFIFGAMGVLGLLLVFAFASDGSAE